MNMFDLSASRRVLALGLILGAGSPVLAAEGGLTNYLPGYYGDFAVAVAPTTGLYGYATYYNYTGRTEGPDTPDTLELEGALRLSGFQYVSDSTVLGARFALGGYISFINAALDSTDPGMPLSAETSGHGDSSISPLILYWSVGNFHVSFYEAIILPTGKYSTSRPLNPGRNYVSFDSVLAFTWLDPALGVEISVVPGVMINTRNPSSDWHTGAEFHADVMINTWLSQDIAVGVHGYVYQQIADDTGLNVPIGLRSNSVGIGPSVMVKTKPFGINGKLVGKWLHEVEADNRFKGDILSITFAAQF